MIVLLQRVNKASVMVESEIIGQIGQGLLVFVGVEKADTDTDVKRLANKVLSYRVFSDQKQKMNLNIQDIQGEMLIVSQFTLAANTQKGARPSFSSAAEPEKGLALFNHFVELVKSAELRVQTGQFGADMQVSLVNDGPATFVLRSNES